MTTKTKTVWIRSPVNYRVSSVDQATTGNKLYSLALTRTGVPNPFWRTQVKNNTSATTTLSAVRNKVSFESGKTYAMRWDRAQPSSSTNPLIESFDGNYMADLAVNAWPVNPSSLSVTVAQNQALTRLYKAIRSQTTHFSGGTFLGELKESLETIRNVTRKIANRIPQHLAAQQKLIKRYVGSYVVGANGSAVRVKDFNPRKGKRLSLPEWAQFRKELADNWLEYAFGIRPLVNDVHDAAESVARFKYDNIHDHVRAYGNSRAVQSQTQSNWSFGQMQSGSYRVVTESEVTVIFRAGLQFAVDSPAFGTAERLRGLLGFKLEDFVPTMWNLLPYSFLVDYFVDVGGILNAITTDISAVRWVSETQLRTNRTSYKSKAHVVFGNPLTDSIGGDVGSVVLETTTVDRFNSSLQIPVPVLEIPGFLNDRGAFNEQLVNMLALLTGGKGARRGF